MDKTWIEYRTPVIYKAVSFGQLTVEEPPGALGQQVGAVVHVRRGALDGLCDVCALLVHELVGLLHLLVHLLINLQQHTQSGVDLKKMPYGIEKECVKPLPGGFEPGRD